MGGFLWLRTAIFDLRQCKCRGVKKIVLAALAMLGIVLGTVNLVTPANTTFRSAVPGRRQQLGLPLGRSPTKPGQLHLARDLLLVRGERWVRWLLFGTAGAGPFSGGRSGESDDAIDLAQRVVRRTALWRQRQFAKPEAAPYPRPTGQS
jgi:hypothetical protein